MSTAPTPALRAPFPYFGGKSGAANRVWPRFGDVKNYVEPFCGSAAMLLARPGYDPARHIETINDADGFVANFWRALASDPDAVAVAADWPVNEVDLFARHAWLVTHRAALREHLEADPAYYDTQIAGWWAWGACAWIGSGWCSGVGPWTVEDGAVVDRRQLPHLGNAGRGINRQLPHLGDAGRGINRKLPHLGDAGRGINEYFAALAARLRRVRVACGDFQRVLSGSVTTRHGLTAVFLDPPYGDGALEYSAGGNSDKTIARAVREWTIAHGTDPLLRIALCGYDDVMMPDGWQRQCYTARKGYQTAANDQRHGEVVWFSPHCQEAA